MSANPLLVVNYPIPSSSTNNIYLGIYNFDSPSGPSLNTSINSFMTNLSSTYSYSVRDNNVVYFRTIMNFTLSSPLNVIDPTQVVAIQFSNTSSSDPSTGPTLGKTYILQIMISQGGRTLSSPIYLNALPTSGSWYIPVSNFFSIASPGVNYRLCVEGNLQAF